MLMTEVGSDEQLLPDKVKINCAAPPDLPITKPLLSTVAISLSLLVHVPPDEGLRWVESFSQITDNPVTDTMGLTKKSMESDGKELQP